MDLDQHYIVNDDDFAYGIVDDKIIILDLSKGDYFVLNKTATKIWRFIINKKSLNSALIFLANKYSINQEYLKRDINDIVKKFVKNKFIKKTKDRCRHKKIKHPI